MRRFSLKRAKHNRAVQPARENYKHLFTECQWCDERDGISTHEISRGASRGKSLGERAALLNLCIDCHRIMDWLPVSGQLAIKLLTDPEGYDRRKVNELRGREPESITDEDVDLWVRRLQLRRATL